MNILYGYWIFSVLVLIGGKAPFWNILLAPITFPIALGITLRKLLNK